MPARCSWARTPLSIAYHDEEWGVPLHDDTRLFEFLILEGAQAGLSWETILRKRDNYRAAFDGFEPAKVAKYNQRKIEALLKNDGIIRNRLKINFFLGKKAGHSEQTQHGYKRGGNPPGHVHCYSLEYFGEAEKCKSRNRDGQTCICKKESPQRSRW